MDIDIRIADSYRTVDKNYWKRIGKFYAENVWKLPVGEATERVRVCFASFEKEYAVKWFEIAAYQAKEMVGFMRLLRDPDDDTRWFVCDVHTAIKCRRNGIATKMLESAIETVKGFESAEYIVSSISASNKSSIGLHEKLGFTDTKVYPQFANFEFEDDETEYKLRILLEYPAKNIDSHRRILYKLMRRYMEKQMSQKKDIYVLNKGPYSLSDSARIVKKMISVAESDENEGELAIIWNGNNPIGFKYLEHNEELRFVMD